LIALPTATEATPTHSGSRMLDVHTQQPNN
jgi:hypothetical protein